MCGVVGFIGNENSVPFLLDGLSKLEYRGYDSAGLAVHNGNEIDVVKTKGRLQCLRDKLETMPITGNLGIGHTRWATHGKPSDENSHPHQSGDNSIAVVHNGIIENYIKIKEMLETKGYSFVSETDTETIAHLLDYYLSQNFSLIDSVFKVVDEIEGSYALGIICKSEPNTLIAARKDSPLIIGLGKDVNYIASDIPAILNFTREVYLLDDNEVAIIKTNSVEIFDKNKNIVNREIFKIDWDMDAAEKGGYEHFMLKEIYEQPKVVNDTISRRLLKDSIELDTVNLDKALLEKINKIYIVACGTAYYAGLVGKFVIEHTSGINVISEVASEFRYNDPIIDEHTLLIVVSQSGETADTLAALRLGKVKGATTLAIVNVIGSSIARDADNVLYTLAGPEIAVASTKAFTSQLAAMYLLAYKIGLEKGTVTVNDYKEFKKDLELLPKLVGKVLDRSKNLEEFTKRYINSKNVFYIGRGLDYLISMEGSLKLKEIAYLHSEPYAAGELKHGPIALIEESTLIIGVVTQEHLFDKTVSNLRECKARGAKIIVIAIDDNTEIEKYADEVLYIPRTHKYLAPLLANVYQQLFAYYMSKLLGNDVDKPRNLAKSVTVE